jgi:hypothetical protein
MASCYHKNIESYIFLSDLICLPQIKLKLSSLFINCLARVCSFAKIAIWLSNNSSLNCIRRVIEKLRLHYFRNRYINNEHVVSSRSINTNTMHVHSHKPCMTTFNKVLSSFRMWRQAHQLLFLVNNSSMSGEPGLYAHPMQSKLWALWRYEKVLQKKMFFNPIPFILMILYVSYTQILALFFSPETSFLFKKNFQWTVCHSN